MPLLFAAGVSSLYDSIYLEADIMAEETQSWTSGNIQRGKQTWTIDTDLRISCESCSVGQRRRIDFSGCLLEQCRAPIFTSRAF